jgi:surface carbohydrate biosynthesis protein (TIGR04326 family)
VSWKLVIITRGFFCRSNNTLTKLNGNTDLLVCWNQIDTSDETITSKDILSFLSLTDEEELIKKWHGNFFLSRVVSQEIRDQARKLYVEAVTRIGVTAFGKQNKSFRAHLADNESTSHWWYHNVSFRDCESDAAFNQLIVILTVIKLMNDNRYSNLVLHGASVEVAGVLKELYPTRTFNCLKKTVELRDFIRACLGRCRYFFRESIKIRALQSLVTLPNSEVDVAISGFWDWSVKPLLDGNAKLADRYFKLLPQKLIERGVKLGWFVWLDPDIEPGLKRSLVDMITPAVRDQRVVFFQSFLSIRDVIKSIFDARPLIVYLQYVASGHLKRVLKIDGMNLYNIFQPLLLKGFLDSSIGHHRLVAIASRRALEYFHPKVMLHFLEFFPHSRAIYGASNAAGVSTVHYAMQHASYCREKTFILYDKDLELAGKPDGYGVPIPDYIFAMGTLGRDLFCESGISHDRILLTGSARYDHIIKDTVFKKCAKDNQATNILLACSLNIDNELDMIEAAYIAAQNIPGLRLTLRSHPFARVENRDKFSPYSEWIRVSNASLEDDLAETDLIIFTSTTVAEEAVMRGIPVWQWRSYSYNSSVFRDIEGVPWFCTATDLREAVIRFMTSPESFAIDANTIKDVEEKCFYLADGKASERIADEIEKISRYHR